MTRLIDLDIALRGIDNNISNLRANSLGCAVANKAIDLIQYTRDYLAALPTVDAVPVKQSYWEEYETSSFWGYDENGEDKWVARKFYRCERCRKGTAIRSNFCPNCGAKMDGERSEGE